MKITGALSEEQAAFLAWLEQNTEHYNGIMRKDLPPPWRKLVKLLQRAGLVSTFDGTGGQLAVTLSDEGRRRCSVLATEAGWGSEVGR